MSIFENTKNELKQILPPPVSSFMREINALKAELSQQRDKLSKLHEENRKLLDELRGVREDSKKQIGELSELHEANAKQAGELARIYSAIPGKPVLWHNEFERGVVRANWGKVTDAPDFKEKYLRLISGLDRKSVIAINRIIARQKKYLNTDKKELDLFTRDEQEALRLLNENFNQEIFKVSDDLFVYRNYLLPVNHFEASVFYYRHGLDEVQTLDRVKGKTILDVGGYIGDSVLILSELGPKAIYSFEADPENFELMQKTIALRDSEYRSRSVRTGGP